ncbi:MAG: hypothetical protein ACJAQT_004968 [Akkermansiaceae bacterium]|jgi:hypothetical protein
MNKHQATSFKPDFSIEKFSGGSVVSHCGRIAISWMTRLYATPGGNDF